MKINKYSVLAIFAATLWISFSEYLRNEILLKPIWVNHFDHLGLIFPDKPINGATWGIWSFCFAIIIYFINTKFSFFQSVILSWFAGFILMWISLWNLKVFPICILIFAVPLSLIEVAVANFIIVKIRNNLI